MSAAPQTQAPVIYVGFWHRFLAFVIDSIAVSILIYPIMRLVLGPDMTSLTEPATLGEASAMINRLAINLGIESLLVAIIFLAFWMYFGSSPGKMIFKGYIVKADTLQPASNGQLIVRYLGYFVSLLTLGLGFVWIGLDKRKQGWHDKMAGTVVIRRLDAGLETRP